MMFQRVTFSTVTSADFKKAGVERKRLIFEQAKVTALINEVTTDTKAEIADLHSRTMYASTWMCVLTLLSDI